LRIVFPPCNHAEFEVLQLKGPISIFGRNSAGQTVASVTGAGASASPQTIVLEDWWRPCSAARQAQLR
jgi:hypothetical protein